MNLLNSKTLLKSTVIDVDRNDLFSQLGQLRSPFRNVLAWPYLGDEFEEHSRALLQSVGTDRWRELGGDRDEQGLTLRSNSEAADEVLQRFEQIDSGFVVEEGGRLIAVRLIRGRKQGRRFGLGLQFEHSHSSADATNGLRCETSLCPGQIRIGARGEQLLWLIHAEVMRHRRSVVQLPDPVLKELFWDRGAVPRDWRRDLEWTFHSLMNLRLDVLNLNRRGWQPRLGSSSILLDQVDFSWNLGELGPSCNETCSMWGSGQRHHHVRIGIGHAFLGVLEKSAFREDHGIRIFDFKVQKSDRSATMPVRPVFNALIAKRSLQLSQVDRTVLNGILSEITVGTAGNAQMQCGRTTPKIDVPCPFLSSEGQYISFNGNGVNSGYGYLIEGRNRTGWLYKAGLTWPPDHKRHVTRKLFQSLTRLGDHFGITPCGYSQSESRWYSLSEMLALSNRSHGWNVLGGLLLRIYAPSDFACKVLAAIGGDSAQVTWMAEQESLNDRLRASNLSHQEIASWLGVSREFVTVLMNSRRSWPVNRARDAEQLLSRVNDLNSSK